MVKEEFVFVEAEPVTTGAGKRYAPFGVGQFANGQSTKGVAFAASEGALFAIAGTSLGLFLSEKNGDGTFENPDRAQAYRALFWSSLGVGIGVAAWGVVDAVREYRKIGQKTAKRRFRVSGPSISMNF
jgi:hypothetical protein